MRVSECVIEDRCRVISPRYEGDGKLSPNEVNTRVKAPSGGARDVVREPHL